MNHKSNYTNHKSQKNISAKVQNNIVHNHKAENKNAAVALHTHIFQSPAQQIHQHPIKHQVLVYL